MMDSMCRGRPIKNNTFCIYASCILKQRKNDYNHEEKKNKWVIKIRLTF